MQKLMAAIGAFVGGTAGWWIGAHVGTMTAFIVSTVGMGAGIYWARKVGQRYLE